MGFKITLESKSTGMFAPCPFIFNSEKEAELYIYRGNLNQYFFAKLSIQWTN